LVDAAGRVERFKQKFKWTDTSTGKSSADAQEAVAVEEKPETGSAD